MGILASLIQFYLRSPIKTKLHLIKNVISGFGFDPIYRPMPFYCNVVTSNKLFQKLYPVSNQKDVVTKKSGFLLFIIIKRILDIGNEKGLSEIHI